MARYIDLDELLTNIDKRNGRLPLWLDEILMEDCKVADVAPVRHGYWYNRGGRFRCSVCDNKALLKDIGGTGGWSHEYEQQKSPYCPNCGARMDGDTDANGNDNKTPKT